MNKYPHKKYSVYDPQYPQCLRKLEDRFLEDDYGPTICAEHIIMAHMIDDKVKDPELRKELLGKVDVVFDMGKRMGKKLVEYCKEQKKPWKPEGF